MSYAASPSFLHMHMYIYLIPGLYLVQVHRCTHYEVFILLPSIFIYWRQRSLDSFLRFKPRRPYCNPIRFPPPYFFGCKKSLSAAAVLLFPVRNTRRAVGTTSDGKRLIEWRVDHKKVRLVFLHPVKLLPLFGHFAAPNPWNDVASLVLYGPLEAGIGRNMSGWHCRRSSTLNVGGSYVFFEVGGWLFIAVVSGGFCRVEECGEMICQ